MNILTTLADVITRRPFVSPDEVFYADVARHFVEHGRLGLQLWGTTIPGLPDHVYFYPPLFYVIIAGWSVIFGPSLVAQRLLTLAAAGLFALIIGGFTTACVRRTSNCSRRTASAYGVGAAILIASQATFIPSATMSRPEIFMLLFGVLAMYIVVRAHDCPSHTPARTRLFLLGGVVASGAMLIHPIGVLFPVSILLSTLLRREPQRLRDALVFSIATGLPIGVWLITIAPHLDVLWQQLALGIMRKRYDPSLLHTVTSFHVIARLPIVAAIIVALSAVSHAPKRRTISLLLPTITLIMAIIAVAGTSPLYIALIPPFSVVIIAIFTADALSTRWHNAGFTPTIYGALSMTLACALFIVNIRVMHAYVSLARTDHRSYMEYARAITASIPESSTVFVSAIPDPSFGFILRNPQQPIRQFPGLVIPRDRYLALLGESDYIIYNKTLEAPVFGSFLRDYISANALRTTTVNADMSDWVTDVIELIPREERVTAL